MGVGEPLTNACERALVNREIIGVDERVAFEDDAVVDAVEALRLADEISPRRTARAEFLDNWFRFDQLVFQETHEDEPIQRALCGFGQLFTVQMRIAIFEGARQFFAQFVKLLQERFIDAAIAAGRELSLRGFARRLGQGGGKFSQRARVNGLAREEIINLFEYIGNKVI